MCSFEPLKWHMRRLPVKFVFVLFVLTIIWRNLESLKMLGILRDMQFFWGGSGLSTKEVRGVAINWKER